MPHISSIPQPHYCIPPSTVHQPHLLLLVTLKLSETISSLSSPTLSLASYTAYRETWSYIHPYDCTYSFGTLIASLLAYLHPIFPASVQHTSRLAETSCLLLLSLANPPANEHTYVHHHYLFQARGWFVAKKIKRQLIPPGTFKRDPCCEGIATSPFRDPLSLPTLTR